MALSSNACSTRTTTIDSLSESLILLIFSFLPTVDAIRASLVCKTWLNLWHHVPTLNLDIVPFHSPLNSYTRTRELFTEFVNQALSVRPDGLLHKLYIRFDCSYSGDCKNLTSWIKYAINCGVNELDVDLHTCDLNTIQHEEYRDGQVWTSYELDDYIDYRFDFSCLINKSVEVLRFHIGCCEFPLLPPIVQPTDFASLRSLTLNDVSFEECDEELARLVQNCVNLEHLTISDCYGLRRIKISSSKLKTCKIVGSRTLREKPSLVITSACLNSLFLWHVLVENNLSKGCPNLIKVEVSWWDRLTSYYGWWCGILKSLTWVKCLIVQNMYFAQGHLGHEEMLPPLYNFNNLSHLELLTGYNRTDVTGICLFLKNAPELKSLVINYYYYPRNGDEATITEGLMNDTVTLHLPRLEKVEMKNYRGTIGELFTVELLKVHGVVLEKVVVFPVQSGEEKLKPFTLWTASDERVRGDLKCLRKT